MMKPRIDPRVFAFFSVADSIAKEYSKGWFGRPDLIKQIRLRSEIIRAMTAAYDMADQRSCPEIRNNTILDYSERFSENLRAALRNRETEQ